MKRLAWLICAPLVLSLPALAQAEDGFAMANVNLRAGPDVSYPRITTVPAGASMNVQGCTDGWEWCDVITMGTRGWVAGDYIQYEYQNQRVVAQDYGSRIGIPVISFVIGSYWANNYRDRPFYQQRDYWYHRPIRHRPPPRRAHRPPSRPPPISHRPSSPWHGTNRPGNAHRPPTHRPSSAPTPPRHRPAQGNTHPVQGNRPAPSAGHNRNPRAPTGNNHAPTNRPATKPASHASPPSRPTHSGGDKRKGDDRHNKSH